MLLTEFPLESTRCVSSQLSQGPSHSHAGRLATLLSLFGEHRKAGQVFAANEFQRCPSTGRDMTHFRFQHLGFAQSRHSVPAANDSHSSTHMGQCHGACNADGAFSEFIFLKRAQGAISKNGAVSPHKFMGVGEGRLRADIERLRPLRDDPLDHLHSPVIF